MTVDVVADPHGSAAASAVAPWAQRRRRRRADLGRLVVRRLLLVVPIAVVVSIAVFALSALSPFDPLAAYLGDRYQRMSPQDRAELTRALGLDASWWTAWTTWATGLLGGDLGASRVFGQPVTQVLGERVPWTLLLSGGALLLASVTALWAGIAAGLRPGRALDRIVERISVLLQAVPPFVLSLGFITVFALGLGWFPAGGATDPRSTGPVSTVSVMHHLALPMLVLGLSQVPWLALAVRESTRTALGSDPVRAAVARGLPWRTVIRGHVLPPALVPLLPLLGVRLPEVVVGAVLVEEVFAWPGIAAAFVASAQQLDFPLLAFLTVASTVLVLLGSLLADVAHAALDPRVATDG